MSSHGIYSDMISMSPAHKKGTCHYWDTRRDTGLLIAVLTRGKCVSADSISAVEAALWEFLCSEGVDAPFSIVYGCVVPPFLVFGITEVDIVERRSLVAILEASDREPSGLRGRPII